MSRLMSTMFRQKRIYKEPILRLSDWVEGTAQEWALPTEQGQLAVFGWPGADQRGHQRPVVDRSVSLSHSVSTTCLTLCMSTLATTHMTANSSSTSMSRFCSKTNRRLWPTSSPNTSQTSPLISWIASPARSAGFGAKFRHTDWALLWRFCWPKTWKRCNCTDMRSYVSSMHWPDSPTASHRSTTSPKWWPTDDPKTRWPDDRLRPVCHSVRPPKSEIVFILKCFSYHYLWPLMTTSDFK